MTIDTGNMLCGELDGTRTEPLSERVLVLVKFTLSNRSLVPRGIREVERQPDIKIDMKHRLDALNLKLGRDVMRTGRFRAGRVDTGVPMIQDPGLCHAALLRRGLANNGFRLVDLHYFRKPPAGDKSWAKEKFIIVGSYEPPFSEDQVPLKVTDSILDALRALSAMTWNNCVVWDNPNASLTVNFGGRAANAIPKCAIRVQDGRIVSSPVTGFVCEEDE